MIAVFRKTQGKFISIGFLMMGIFVLMQIILPILSFEMWAAGRAISSQGLISPKSANEGVLGISVQNKDNFPVFISDMTREIKPDYTQFQLSVPRLKIDASPVYVDSNDLSKGLVQLPGSALPGQKGNLFISGHSALSRFLGGGTAIFAKLTDLKKGDEIIAEAGSARFVYKVTDIKVVDPLDLSVILPPDTQGRYISLMTCVPPGLNFKRLVVVGELL